MAEPNPNPNTRLSGLRILAGLIMVPPTAVLIALATYDRFWHAGLLPQGAPIDSLDSAGSVGAGVGILATVMTCVGVVPGVVWLKARGTLSLSRFLMLGAVLGSVPFAVIIIGIVAVHLGSGTLSADIGQYWEGWSGAGVRTAMGLICGIGSAAVFWVVAVRGTVT
jgi:hypothetical protein